MSYEIYTDLAAFKAQLQPGDVLAYDTMTPQGGLIQFADRRNVSHISMYVGDGHVVDASSRPAEPGRPQKPIRYVELGPQFPTPPDPGALDRITHNRSMIALRHLAFSDDGLGDQAADIARQVYAEQGFDPNHPWKFSPNDLLILTPLVLARSYETAYQFSPFVKQSQTATKLIKRALRLLRWMFDPHDADDKPGVTCSELAHRILSHPTLRIALTLDDGRKPLSEYADGVLETLAADETDLDLVRYAAMLAWHRSPERRSQLADVDGFGIGTEAFETSDLVSPGDFLGFKELEPVAGYELPIRSGGKPI